MLPISKELDFNFYCNQRHLTFLTSPRLSASLELIIDLMVPYWHKQNGTKEATKSVHRAPRRALRHWSHLDNRTSTPHCCVWSHAGPSRLIWSRVVPPLNSSKPLTHHEWRIGTRQSGTNEAKSLNTIKLFSHCSGHKTMSYCPRKLSQLN